MAAGGSSADSVAAHFIRESPPGQAPEVVKDLRSLLPRVSEEVIVRATEENAVSGLMPVTVPGKGYQVVLCGAGRVGAGVYVDSKSLSLIRVSFADGIPQVEGEADAESAGGPLEHAEVADLRRALASAASEYAGQVFADHKAIHGGGDAFAPPAGPQAGSVVVALSGLKPNLRNYWAGRWSSQWTVQPSSASEATLAGEIWVHAHYFENGNMQLRGARKLGPAPVRAGAGGSLAKAVIAQIQAWEEEVHAGLQDTYAAMDREALKEIRRFLTVSGTGFSWNIYDVRNKGALSK